jgi:hypothetical protein
MVIWLAGYYIGDITVHRVALCLNKSVSFSDALQDITLILHLLTDGSVYCGHFREKFHTLQFSESTCACIFPTQIPYSSVVVSIARHLSSFFILSVLVLKFI